MDDTKPIKLSKSDRKRKQEANRRIGAKLRAEMVQKFPAIFSKKGGVKMPLKIGISQDIIDTCPDIKPWKVKAFLNDYTHGPRYLLALATGGARYALDGTPCGEVTPDQQDLARCMIAKHWPKWETKIKVTKDAA